MSFDICLHKLSSLPFDIEQSPRYEIVYFFASWSVFTATHGFAAIIAFFLGICMHFSAQFEILSLRLETLLQRELESEAVSDKFIKKLSSQQNQKLHKGLKEIVEKHNELGDLCQLMSAAFAPIVVFHFVSSAILICITSIMILLTEGEELWFHVLTLGAFLGEAYLFALAGDTLIDTSMGLRNAAYNFHWYKCDCMNRKMILTIIARAQKKICIDAPFFQASMESFVSVSS